MADLGLSCPELSEYLRYRAGFNTSSKQFVQFFGAGSYLDDFRTLLMEFRGSGEPHGHKLACLYLKLYSAYVVIYY